MRRLLALAAVVIAATSAHAAGTSGSTYYVSATGSDANPGSAAAPWRTVARVNRAPLAPGDTVLFQGGATFTDQTLMPSSSGAASAPVTFGSFGVGQARIANAEGAVWIPGGAHDLVFDGLDLSSGSSIVFAAAGSGAPVSAISLRNSTVHDSPYAGLVEQPQDFGWSITGNTFIHLGDSGLLVQGPQTTIDRNTITDTGWNPALTYGKHGIYAKAANMTISNNDISNDPNGSAVSLRYGGARVFGNTIHDTPYAISLFPQDPANSGVDRIYSNRLWNISGWAFYYNGSNGVAGAQSGIDVVWTSNTTRLAGADEAVNVSEITAANVTIANSIFTGTFGSAYRGCATCSEHHNDWYGGTSNLPSGAGDRRVAPGLSAAPALAPIGSSPVVDAGTISVANVLYSSSCDAKPMSYCQASPDQGAVEFGSSSTSDTAAPSAPAGVAFGSVTQTGGALSWTASTDNRGVAGYDVYADGARLASVTSVAFAISGLACGTTHTFGVVAYDASGNRSPMSTVSGSTAACPLVPPPPADTVPPTVGFVNATDGSQVGRTATFQLRADDASGVTSLTMSIDGTPACSATTGTLSCTVTQRGSHTLSASASDAAGNSASASIRVRFSGH